MGMAPEMVDLTLVGQSLKILQEINFQIFNLDMLISSETISLKKVKSLPLVNGREAMATTKTDIIKTYFWAFLILKDKFIRKVMKKMVNQDLFQLTEKLQINGLLRQDEILIDLIL